MNETTARKPARPWKMALPLAGVIVLAVAWSGFWWWASGKGEQAFDRWRIRLADQGSDLSCGKISTGGYPFRIEIHCDRPLIRETGTDNSVTASRLDIIAQAYDPSLVIARWTGPTVFATLGAEQYTLTHLPWMTSIHLVERQPDRVSSLVREVALSARGREVLRAAEVNFHLRRSGADGLDLAGHANDTRFAGLLAKVPAIDQVEFLGQLKPAPAKLRGPLDYYLSEAAALGGVVTLESVRLAWAGAGLEASGAIALERNGLPKGKLEAAVTGLDDFLKRLRLTGGISKKDETGAAILFGLFKRDDKGRLNLTVTLSGGEVFFGPVRIFQHGALY